MKKEITIDLKVLSIAIIVVLISVIGFLAFQLTRPSTITGASTLTGGCSVGQTGSTGSSSSSIDVAPKGVPEIYGNDLGISFDDVTISNPQKADDTIGKLGNLDNTINLAGDDLQRYIGIVSQISCEYCCGAESIIFSNGQAACGCAHSYAMRGLAKYLITKHGSEYTDDEILEELGKWKTLFFPSQISLKAEILKEKGIEINYINLASNKYRGIEQGASSGSMVGGC